MDYVYYLHLGMIADPTAADLATLKSVLKASLAKAEFESLLEIEDHHLRVQLPRYGFSIHYVAGPHVQEESTALAHRRISDVAFRDTIAGCTARFEFYGDDDPDLHYLEIGKRIVEGMASMPGVHVYDPYRGQFIR